MLATTHKRDNHDFKHINKIFSLQKYEISSNMQISVTNPALFVTSFNPQTFIHHLLIQSAIFPQFHGITNSDLASFCHHEICVQVYFHIDIDLHLP